MTKEQEFCNWFRKRFGFRESAANEVADKVEEIWGISGNNLVILSNLPSKEEFRNVWKRKVESADEIYDWLVSQIGQPANEATKEEPAYKEIPFSMEEYKKHPDCLYLKETDAPIKELVHFNTARYSFQYAGTVNGDLHLFMSGNEFFLKIPVKMIRREGWVNVYKGRLVSQAYVSMPIAIANRNSSEELVDTVKIEWEEEE